MLECMTISLVYPSQDVKNVTFFEFSFLGNE